MKNLSKILYSSLLLAFILSSCSDDDELSGTTNFSRFSFEQDFLTVTFTPSNKENITSYAWDFGDGQTSTASDPSVNYENFGTYIVTLTINDGAADVSGEVTVVPPTENASSFTEIESLMIGGEGAAEISAYDSDNQRLFVVNNDGASSIDVINFSNPSNLSVISSIDVSSLGGGVNSVAVGNGLLAAAIEADDKQANGSIVIWKLNDLTSVEANLTVGALPDMVTFTNDGAHILVANEGEPDDDYINDPEGSISIISVTTTANESGETEYSFSAVTLDFTGFNSMKSSLEANAFRVFGPNASLAQDVEPEYIAISADNSTAYVSLQENNGVAIVDISSQSISSIVALGLKDYSIMGNEIDPSNEDGAVTFRSVPVFGMYQPDALASYAVGGTNYIVTANEGDAREYEGTPGFVGEDRVKDVVLDPTVFSDASTLQEDENLGRLKLSISDGDIDNDGDYDEIWSYGARSFSIWNGTTGELVWDSGNDLEVRVNNSGFYDDGRSDDKGVEPEGVVIGYISGSPVAFIGLERVDAVAVYDISDPRAPEFLTLLEAGDAPEGLVFINAAQSPTRKSLLVVSSEDDGTVKVYETAN